MGRRDLTEERTVEILKAFARCIVRYGLDTSLDQVAQEAQMTRSIIRHYIGNREEVVNTLIERIGASYLAELDAAAATLPEDQLIPATLDYLFAYTASEEEDNYEKLVFIVMMTAKERYPQAKKTLVRMFEALVELFSVDLCKAYPQADADRCREVAYSILALSMSNDAFAWLGMDQTYRRAARASAEALIRTLA